MILIDIAKFPSMGTVAICAPGSNECECLLPQEEQFAWRLSHWAPTFRRE